MNKCHQEILEQIKSKGRKETFYTSSNYSGSSHPRFCLSVPESRIISKNWAIDNKDISLKAFLALTHSLYKGESIDEKKIAGQLLQYLPHLRLQINPRFLKSWLSSLEGWEEIDSLCQSVFSYKDMLQNWKDWGGLLKGLSKDSSLSHKRASLVLLTGSVYQSEDKRIADIAFENIGRLKNETNILITKAISWLMRALIKNHRGRLELFLKENKDYLPKIAVREVTNKLTNGKK